MNQAKLNEYYKNLINKMNQISNQIIELNDLYSQTANILDESLVVDGEVVGKKDIENVKKQSTTIRNEITNQIIPNLRSKIR